VRSVTRQILLALPGLVGCEEPDPCALDARPASIDEALATIGALPSPVTLTCFLVALERPLALELTSDVFSAQPAQGVESPRIFLRSGALTMSVVPVGEARTLLEFGEHHPSGLTVKAELAFPVEVPVDPAAAFDRVLAYDGAPGTGCAVCHFEELDLGGGRFASTPLRPPDGMIVPLEVLRSEHETCDPSADAERCAMFSALLDHGEVEHLAFPEHYLSLTGD
jgi:hypothetical protein